jgi:phosphohistidine phosphatase
MRHAKSDWNASYQADHDRPLAPRGVAAAQTMGRFLGALKRPPAQILSSTALRARRTAEIAREHGGWQTEIEVLAELYAATETQMLEISRAAGKGVQGPLLVVGHEPALSALIRLLSGAMVRFPTAAVACLRPSDPARALAAPAGAELRWLVTPKLLQRTLGLEWAQWEPQ